MRLTWHRCPGTPGAGCAAPAPEGAPTSAPPARGADWAPPAPPRPLVVLLTWVGAQERHIATYVSLLHSCGWDALVAPPPALAIWTPAWAARNARAVLAALDDELRAAGERPVVFFSFSGAIKSVYYRLLLLLAGGGREAAAFAAVRRCAVGQAFDSPVDFTSEAGQRLLAPAGPGPLPALARGALSAAAGALDFALLEAFEADRAAMWSALRHPPFKGPVLILYSYCDGLVDAARVAALARQLRLSGHAVLEQAWPDSPHVAHAAAHPDEYASCVRWLLRGAEQEWAARAARAAGGGAESWPPAAAGPEGWAAAAGGGGGGGEATPVLVPQAAAALSAAALPPPPPQLAPQPACACERGGAPPAAPPPAAAQQQWSYHYFEEGGGGGGGPWSWGAPPPAPGGSTEERARRVMRELGVSPGTIDAVAAQIAQQCASSTRGGAAAAAPAAAPAGGRAGAGGVRVRRGSGGGSSAVRAAAPAPAVREERRAEPRGRAPAEADGGAWAPLRAPTPPAAPPAPPRAPLAAAPYAMAAAPQMVRASALEWPGSIEEWPEELEAGHYHHLAHPPLQPPPLQPQLQQQQQQQHERRPAPPPPARHTPLPAGAGRAYAPGRAGGGDLSSGGFARDPRAPGAWAAPRGGGAAAPADAFLPRLGLAVRRGGWQEPAPAPVAALAAVAAAAAAGGDGGAAALILGPDGPILVRLRSRL
ncbi:MAG: hypothetical protein J3K34DRAFT_461927 [Monoraphidium minutum]|nr:MAG: hypothetical protein J3K34DRAFT_461927 [Monoraphidium minutum]